MCRRAARRRAALPLACVSALALFAAVPGAALAQRGNLYQGPGGGWLETDGGPNSHFLVGWIPKSPSGSSLSAGWLNDLGLAQFGLTPAGQVTIPPPDANGNIPGGILSYLPGPAGFGANRGAVRGAESVTGRRPDIPGSVPARAISPAGRPR